MQTTAPDMTTERPRSGLRTFYALAASQTVSQIGSTMSFLAVGIYVYAQTGQATPLALLSMFMLLPYLIASGIAGVLADRYDRRKLMIIGDTGAALASVALVISLASGNFQLWHLYAAAMWQGVFSTIQRPAFEASVSQLVPEAQRNSANAIMQISKPTAILLASALTGFLYAALGVLGIFAIDLLTFLVAVVTSLLVRIPMPARSEEAAQARPSMLREWGAGIKFLWARRPLFILVALGALFSTLISSVYALTTPYVLARTGSEVTLGILTAIMSVGGIVGAIAIGAWGGFKRRVYTILLGMMLVVGATIVFGANLSPLALGAALFVAMLSVSIMNTVLMTLLQAKVPGDMQGRIFAIVMQVTLALMPLGYLLIGPLADQVFTPLASAPTWTASPLGTLFGSGAAGGMGLLFAVSGALGLIVALLTFALRSVRQMEATLPSYQGAADAVPTA